MARSPEVQEQSAWLTAFPGHSGLDHDDAEQLARHGRTAITLLAPEALRALSNVH